MPWRVVVFGLVGLIVAPFLWRELKEGIVHGFRLRS